MGSLPDFISKTFLFLFLAVIALLIPWLTLRNSFKGGQVRGTAMLAAAAVICFIHLTYLSISPKGILRLSIHSFVAGQEIAPLNPPLDQTFVGFSQRGNVLLRFLDFEETKHLHWVIEFYYYRSVYAVYPRRVFCGDRNDAINSATDVLKIAFAPDDAWLDGHNVATVVAYRSVTNEQGELTRDVKRRH